MFKTWLFCVYSFAFFNSIMELDMKGQPEATRQGETPEVEPRGCALPP